LRREHGAEPRLAVEDDGRRGVGHRGADAELEEAATDVRGRLDVAVAVLVGITNVDDDDRFSRLQTALELLRPFLWYDLPCFREHLLQGLHGSDITPISGRFKGDYRTHEDPEGVVFRW